MREKPEGFSFCRAHDAPIGVKSGFMAVWSWSCQTSTSILPWSRCIRVSVSHHGGRSNQRTGSSTMRQLSPATVNASDTPSGDRLTG